MINTGVEPPRKSLLSSTGTSIIFIMQPLVSGTSVLNVIRTAVKKVEVFTTIDRLICSAFCPGYS